MSLLEAVPGVIARGRRPGGVGPGPGMTLRTLQRALSRNRPIDAVEYGKTRGHGSARRVWEIRQLILAIQRSR